MSQAVKEAAQSAGGARSAQTAAERRFVESLCGPAGCIGEVQAREGFGVRAAQSAEPQRLKEREGGLRERARERAQRLLSSRSAAFRFSMTSRDPCSIPLIVGKREGARSVVEIGAGEACRQEGC